MKETGILLREARESRKITIKTAAKELKINPKYLEMIEAGSLSTAAKEIYVIGYIKSYAKWLGASNLNLAEIQRKEAIPAINSTNILNESNSLSKASKYKKIAAIAAICIFTLFFSASIILQKAVEKTQISPSGIEYQFVLVSQTDLNLDIYDYKGKLSYTNKMGAGDVYFLNIENNLVKSDKMPQIDVFKGNSTGEFLGTLDESIALQSYF